MAHAVMHWLLVVISLRPISPAGEQANVPVPTLRHERPSGFADGGGTNVGTWISGTLDGIIHVYPFQPFNGDFQHEFGRGLFRDRIAAPYREDRLIGRPRFTAMQVKHADAAVAATFRSFNGGAPREHLRVAILAAGFVALVDISANSPPAFQRLQPVVSTLLKSLHVQ